MMILSGNIMTFTSYNVALKDHQKLLKNGKEEEKRIAGYAYFGKVIEIRPHDEEDKHVVVMEIDPSKTYKLEYRPERSQI